MKGHKISLKRLEEINNIMDDIIELKINHRKYEKKIITQEDYFTFLTGIANKYNINADFDETPEGIDAFEEHIFESLQILGVALFKCTTIKGDD